MSAVFRCGGGGGDRVLKWRLRGGDPGPSALKIPALRCAFAGASAVKALRTDDVWWGCLSATFRAQGHERSLDPIAGRPVLPAYIMRDFS